MRCAQACCALALLLLCLPLWATPLAIVLSDESPPYREFASALRSGIGPAAGMDTAVIVGLHEFEAEHAATDPPDTLYVTVGLRAARTVRAARMHSRMLATLIPRESYDALFTAVPDDPVRISSAIFIDQPVARQLDLIRLALPATRRVGVLLGPHSRAQLGELERLAHERDLRVLAESVETTPDLVPAMSRLLPRIDVLLALPDETVFNPSSAETLLLLSYRRSVPLVAFSRAYVKAGALLALHTSPEQFGRQAAEIVLQTLQGAGHALPPPQYPRYFQVSWNRAVAQSLEIPARDEGELALRLGGGGHP